MPTDQRPRAFRAGTLFCAAPLFRGEKTVGTSNVLSVSPSRTKSRHFSAAALKRARRRVAEVSCGDRRGTVKNPSESKGKVAIRRQLCYTEEKSAANAARLSPAKHPSSGAPDRAVYRRRLG